MSVLNAIRKKIKPINGNIIVTIPKVPRSTSDLILDVTENRSVAHVERVSSKVDNTCLFNAGKVLIRKLNPARFADYCLDRVERRFIIPEHEVLGMFDSENRLKPIGRKLLVKRIIESEKLSSGIIIPYGTQTKDQTLWCEIEAFGIPNLNDMFRNRTLAVGDRVMIDPWDMNYIELGNMNGGYYLIVHEDKIAYAEFKPEEEESVLLP
jgi:co-chaperonin GroES (HSP10)